MPRSMTPPLQEYAREVFPAYKKASGLTQAQIGEKIGQLLGTAPVNQSTISKAFKGDTSLEMLLAVVTLAKRPIAEVRARLGTNAAITAEEYARKGVFSYDPPVMSFIADINELPGLRAWLRDKNLRLSQVAHITEAFHTKPPKTDESGTPHGGWDDFAADVLGGELDRRVKADEELSKSLERKHLKRLGSLPARTKGHT